MQKFISLILIILIVLLLGFRVCLARQDTERSAGQGIIRHPVVSGIFYPSDARRLRLMIKNFLKAAGTVELEGELIALLVPHAGYKYSGSIAAWGYKLLEKNNFETIVILGPSHHLAHQGASIYNIGDYRTPLGIAKVNKKLCNEIIAEDEQISYYGPLHQREHSIEVEIPFLQVILQDFSLIPIVIGNRDIVTCKKLADALTRALKTKKVLFIASSDMSHYYEYAIANFIDEKTLRTIEKFSPSELMDKLNNGNVQLCGGSAVVTVMMAAKKFGADKVKVLKYANSGDTSGEKNSVVGYTAVAFYKSSKKSVSKYK
ncbi:MAG: AmmeMemoRadiSam system protein B [Candidatus Omnitrophota bacterium]|nr:AmmeMemoRadiSam system protein B [Candidatus Omnitrophota bacterium]